MTEFDFLHIDKSLESSDLREPLLWNAELIGICEAASGRSPDFIPTSAVRVSLSILFTSYSHPPIPERLRAQRLKIESRTDKKIGAKKPNFIFARTRFSLDRGDPSRGAKAVSGLGVFFGS
ncbi:MAG: hypothetical protein M3O82_08260 [Verrucomicrobiota bacterium]|nr:hypothetical protein [Verrucomicrobiota bacterium]